MKYVFESDNMKDYLLRTDIVNYDSENIIELYRMLKKETVSNLDYIRKVYEFIRDDIKHSNDIGSSLVTCSASEVLLEKTGICFAKSNLLAALLRINEIPCGFCYQLLRLDEDTSPLILHGLNAVYIEEYDKWIRLDARGNREGIDAQFDTTQERLAFDVRKELGEIDYPYVYINPDKSVVEALQSNSSFEELWDNLPQKLTYVI